MSTVEFITALFSEIDEQLPVFSANNPHAHARERGRKSFLGAGLRADAGG